MRNLIWIIVALVILGGGYLLYSGKTPEEALSGAPAEAVETVVEAVQEAGEAIAETAENASEAAATAAEDTAQAAEELSDEVAKGTLDEESPAAEPADAPAVETTEETSEPSTGEATETAAQETAAETGTTAEATAEEPADEPTDATADAAKPTSDAEETAAVPDLSEVLTVEGFDYDKAVEAIEASDLAATRKALLTAAIEQARDNPDLLRTALESAREALGL